MPADYDDRDDDRRDDGYDDRPRPRRGDVAAAKDKLRGPAIGLIVTGVFGLLFTALNVLGHGNVPAQIEEQVRQVENNPGIPADQKKAQVDMLRQIGNAVTNIGLPVYGLNGLVALAVLAGGVLMLKLSGRGLSYLAAVLAMLPVVNGCCCVIGLPFGIWALIALGNPVVKDGYAAVARGAAD